MATAGMKTAAVELQTVALDHLHESKTNPRKTFGRYVRRARRFLSTS